MKKLIMLLCVSCLSSTALSSSTPPADAASDTEIKLEGFFGFQAGYSAQGKLSSEQSKYITDNKKNLGFYSEAAFSATAKQEFNDVIAGAKIILLTTSKPKGSASVNGSHIFLETDYGKVELGSPYDAANKMGISGAKVAVASCGFSWSKYVSLDDSSMQYKGMKPQFEVIPPTFTDSFSNSFDDISKGTEPSRKVSYYTPEIQGFQFGISYIPDSANTGGHRSIKNLDSKTGRSTLKTGIVEVTLPGIDGGTGNTVIYNYNVKDAISAGISYKYEILDDASVEVGVTGEHAKPARKLIVLDPNGKIVSSNKLSDLNAYNLGAVLTYGNISCAASYGSLGKSLTSKTYHKVGRDTKYYNGTIAYGQGPIKTSLSYFKSLRYKNTVDTVSLGTEYKITPGLLPYAEISYFQAKGKPVYLIEAPKKKTKGTVALIGAKLKF
ncbi:porin [Candidatus Tisiphia endosymbiont of Ditula angustiorana]|uniref:porin n=1 Tax=Candidatus Tisiphia endosymbiont of Ditula angustiorana TaxID=3066272 RepID=UPI00312C9314